MSGVPVWVASDGSIHVIPVSFREIRITKSGWPDRREKRYAEFMAWVRSLPTSGS